MNAAPLLRALETYLRPRVAVRGGLVTTSGTPEDTLHLLTAAPERWRVILQFASWAEVGEAYGAHQAATILAIVQGPRGLPTETGQEVHRTQSGTRPLLEHVDWVRDEIRACRFKTAATGTPVPHPEVDQRGLRFLGGDWLVLDQVEAMRQFELRFEVACAIGPPAVPVEA